MRDYGTYKDKNYEVTYKGKPYYVDFSCGVNYWEDPGSYWEPPEWDIEIDYLEITRMVDENGNDVTGELYEYVDEELAEDLCEHRELFTWDNADYEEEDDEDWYHKMRDEEGFVDSSLRFVESSRKRRRQRLNASANRVYEYILHNYFREDLGDCRNVNDVIDFIVEKGFPANEDTYAAARWIWEDINAA